MDRDKIIANCTAQEYFSVVLLERFCEKAAVFQENYACITLLRVVLFCMYDRSAYIPLQAVQIEHCGTHPMCMYVLSPPGTAPCHLYGNTFHAHSTVQGVRTMKKMGVCQLKIAINKTILNNMIKMNKYVIMPLGCH